MALKYYRTIRSLLLPGLRDLVLKVTTVTPASSAGEARIRSRTHAFAALNLELKPTILGLEMVDELPGVTEQLPVQVANGSKKHWIHGVDQSAA